MSEEYTGVIREIIFHNNENGYTVAVFETESKGWEEEFTIVGNIPRAAAGRTYRLEGMFVDHPSYGEQFKVTSFEEQMPTSEEGIRDFLSSGALKGIGPKTAAAMVALFGDNTFHIIEHEPNRLTEVPGIGPKTAAKVSDAFAQRREFASITLQLQKYDISAEYALKLDQSYGGETVRVLEENPSRLIDDFYGVGFVKADRIAAKMGFKKEEPFRIRSGILFTLNHFVRDGHTFLPEEELCEKAAQLLDLSREQVREQLEFMAFSGEIHVDRIHQQRVVYLMTFYLAEQRVSKGLRLLRDAPLKPLSGGEIGSLIHRTEAAMGIPFSDNQKEAIRTSLENGVSVITGGPGTGKTTIINAIIDILEDSGQKTAIAAPTGRAAKRITETSGHPASTIHRLLEYSYAEGENGLRFGRNSENPLDYDAVIVDEASMIDLLLMDALVGAIRPGTRLLLVGDDDQLPSVGAGNVLRDIISSEYIFCMKLTTVFRQAGESMIVTNAHRINRGEYPECNAKGKDFFLVRRQKVPDMLDTLLDLCVRRLPAFYPEYSPVRDIQVLTPVRKGPLGSLNLNQRLQAVLNPPDPQRLEKTHGDRIFREGDKVMQIRNNYEMKWRDSAEFTEGEGVFNGDVGFIQSIDGEMGEVTVIFDQTRYVTYNSTQLDELELAYAVTVHKSQGSEFPVVVMPVSWFPPVLATRNLLYTAVTRGKTAVVLVGSEGQLNGMVDNNQISLRYSGLAWRLGQLLKLENELRAEDKQ
ncbi:MAG: ATP-dependent RecD-like DNA helicase [Firmicutes bacterium]|nr:ATP-dependent RecD-like DNA helicase [Bacillota bacterium]